MGIEIRRVPKGWEHPKNEDGRFQPMYDKDYETASTEWIAGLMNWENDNDPNTEKYDYKYYWEYAGDPPDRDYYRTFETEPICYQVYETVSEGTPVSPVFETTDELYNWLIEQGHSEYATKQFIEEGWCPSFVMSPKCGVKANIDTFDCK